MLKNLVWVLIILWFFCVCLFLILIFFDDNFVVFFKKIVEVVCDVFMLGGSVVIKVFDI